MNPPISRTPTPRKSEFAPIAFAAPDAGLHAKTMRENHTIVLSSATHRGYFPRRRAFAPLWRRCPHWATE